MYFCGTHGCRGHKSFAVTCADEEETQPVVSLTPHDFKVAIMRQRKERARWRIAYHRPSKLDKAIH